MTILPKKKQQSNSHQQQQQQQQDGRHANMGNVRNLDESAGASSGNPFLTSSSANLATVGGGGGTSSASSSLSSAAAANVAANSTAAIGSAITNTPSPQQQQHGIDVASAPLISCGIGGGGGSSVNIGVGGGANIGGQLRHRPLVSYLGGVSGHDYPNNETDCNPSSGGGSGGGGVGGSSIGPHRKRPAIGGSVAASSGAIGATGSASPRASSQSERSSPYRTTRRSSRGGQYTMVSSSASAPTSAAMTSTGLGSGAYGNAVTAASVPTNANTDAAGAHNVRSNVASPEAKDDEGGQNSEDEYERIYFGENETAPEEIERKFEEQLLKTKSLRIKKMKEDGACLFRAVADQVYGDEEMHGAVRKLCMDYIDKNADYFNQFVTEDFAAYVERKRKDTTHGNHVEMQAMAELFNRPIQVYQYSCDPINTFHSPRETDNPAIRVSYHRNVHYNSVVDPYAATIGIGLGLPQFVPGLAEKNLMRDAVRASEQHQIEEAMLEDKLRATDWEATDEQLHEQVARESYLQWLRDQEKQMKENAATRGGVSTTTTTRNPVPSGALAFDSGRPSCSKSPNVQGDRGDASGNASAVAGASSFYGSNNWEDEEDLLKQVLALSQQEYFDSLNNQCQEEEPDAKKASSSNAPS